jgi:hypothetical protein
VKLNKAQYATLAAIATGTPHTLYPMMRRAFLRAQFIVPAGPVPPPAEVRHEKAPVRDYAVTAAGHAALVSYKGRIDKPVVGHLKMAFGKASTNDEIAPYFERRSRR